MINGSSKVSGFQAKSGSDNVFQVMVPLYQGAGCEPGLHAGLHIGNDRQPKRRDDLPRQSYLDSRGDDDDETFKAGDTSGCATAVWVANGQRGICHLSPTQVSQIFVTENYLPPPLGKFLKVHPFWFL